MKSEEKRSLKIGRIKFGLRKSLLLLKIISQKRNMKVLHLLLRIRVELEKEDNTQSLGKKEQRVQKIKLGILMKKRLS